MYVRISLLLACLLARLFVCLFVGVSIKDEDVDMVAILLDCIYSHCNPYFQRCSTRALCESTTGFVIDLLRQAANHVRFVEAHKNFNKRSEQWSTIYAGALV